MKFIFKIILFIIGYLLYAYKAYSAEIKIGEFYVIGGSEVCFKLDSLSLNNDGFLEWNFKEFLSRYSACKIAKINYVETFPKFKSIRGVRGVNKDKTFKQFFTILTTPETHTLKINTNNRWGVGGSIKIDMSKRIPELINMSISGDWMTNYKNNEIKLKEKIISDTKPPLISLKNIRNNQSVDTYNFFIRGKVTDDKGVISLLVNGKKSSIKSDGTFASKIKLAIGKNIIKIQAEDINNNVAEKSIIIIREEYISELTLADVDIPPKTTMNNSDGLAVVIGIENYQYVPDATYAYNDAEVFREYLSQTLGYKKQRIKLATNSKATQAELNKLLGLNGWISRNIVKGKSDVVVYFSGHGIANQKDKSTGILPFDVDPNYSVGLPLKKLYKDLASMGAKSVTVYLDACFTGQTRDAKMLIADARPIIILPKENATPDNVNVFSAATGSQISGAIKEKEHGLFTYFLLKGLSGDADLNKDKVVKLDELSQFVLKNVKENAALNGREQTPELNSKNNEVLVKFP